jgi:hypothetical protein
MPLEITSDELQANDQIASASGSSSLHRRIERAQSAADRIRRRGRAAPAVGGTGFETSYLLSQIGFDSDQDDNCTQFNKVNTTLGVSQITTIEQLRLATLRSVESNVVFTLGDGLQTLLRGRSQWPGRYRLKNHSQKYCPPAP